MNEQPIDEPDKPPEPKSCFFVAPIGAPKTEIRDRSDKILKYLIRPTVEELGYTVQRADEIDEPGLITSQIINRVVSDDLVIADLTGGNPNVFYELAVRHASRKPFIQLIQANEKIPFDIAASRTIHVDHTDLISVDEAAQSMKKQIQNIERSKTPPESPLSHILRLVVDGKAGISIDDVYQKVADLHEYVEVEMDSINSGYSIDYSSIGDYGSDIDRILDILKDIQYQIAINRKS